MLRTAFTHYWEDETVALIRLGKERLDHDASNFFRKRGVRSGDCVYVMTIRKGKLFLLGRLIVDRVVAKEEAAAILPYEPRDDSDHLLARPGTEVILRLREVPVSIASDLIFYGQGDKAMLLRFLDGKRLDPQTLRNVRRLSLQSAQTLELLL